MTFMAPPAPGFRRSSLIEKAREGNRMGTESGISKSFPSFFSGFPPDPRNATLLNRGGFYVSGFFFSAVCGIERLLPRKEKGIMSTLRKPILVLGVAVYLTLFLTSPTLAGMVGSFASPDLQASEMRSEEIRKIQVALENELVRAKLLAYGLTADEVNQKLDQMSDEQIHLLAQASDDILAGGNGVGLVIGVLVVILLVVLIIKLMDKTVVIR
jgi:hypothetical protein